LRIGRTPSKAGSSAILPRRRCFAYTAAELGTVSAPKHAAGGTRVPRQSTSGSNGSNGSSCCDNDNNGSNGSNGNNG
jgi:hypothetical protein